MRFCHLGTDGWTGEVVRRNMGGMTITLYDLAGADPALRFSPYCWRTKMALAHKGLAVETVPWRFTEKDKLPKPNDGRVPVIIDDGQVVHDSSSIAEYLEKRYPDRPLLFGRDTGQALTRFVQNWTETVLHPGLIGFVVLAGIVIGAVLGLFSIRDKAVLFVASLALTPAIVFNQQIITGQSLQPIHYQVFIGNYVAGLGLAAAVWLILRGKREHSGGDLWSGRFWPS